MEGTDQGKQLQAMSFFVEQKATLLAIAYQTIASQLDQRETEASEETIAFMAISLIENTYTSFTGDENAKA